MGAAIPRWQQAIRDRCVHPDGTFTPFPAAEIDQSIARRFEKQVERHGDRVAVETEFERFTYHELNRAANRIAHTLLALPESGPQPVLHLFDQGVPAVAAALGTLKLGHVYVPLDPSVPLSRLSLIAGESQAALILTDNHNLALAREVAGDRRVLNVDRLDSGVPDDNPHRSVPPDDLAWVVYTSGSTGRPKGVMQTHRNVLYSMRSYTNYFHVCPEDRLSDLFSFSTHAGLFQLLLPLVNGAALLPLDLRRAGLDALARWLTDHEITICCLVPTVFRRFASRLAAGVHLSNLRLIYLAGEPALRTDFDLYRKHLPPTCIFVNRFGSTETDCTRLFFADQQTRIASACVPIGWGVLDKEVSILDERGEPAGVGEIGEITVRSRYISPGYWQRPDLTEAAFASDGDERIYRTGDLGTMDGDGCVEHAGRKDFQVKIRGYRVEIPEIESVLLELPGVKDAAVAARRDRQGAEQLVAYVVPRAEPAPSTSALRSALAEKLPAYMVPAVFLTLAELPHTPNGKVDRRSLPAPGTERPDLASPRVAPRTPVERRVADIWAGVLGIDEVGIHDPFLDLGGDSLLAMQILTRVREAFEVELSHRELLDSRTVALMARTIALR